MSLVAAWALFPAVLLLLATGAGLLVEWMAGVRLPGALLPVTGLALVIVACQFVTLAKWAAEFIVPLAIVLALLGGLLGGRGLVERFDGWPVAVGFGAFAAFAAPIVLSGEATFAGYIKLDDTATWMALTDRVMDAGRSLGGLNPSTYEATLHFNLGDGYPVGALLPFGIAGALSGQALAWTIQPYMAVLGALLALALWQISSQLLESRPLRAVAAFVGSQAALLYGYYLWGGVKEIAAAALIASAVPLATFAVARRGSPRVLAPLAVMIAAVIGVLSAGGILWLAAPLAGALVLLGWSVAAREAARSAVVCVALVTVLSVPVLVTGGLLPPTSSPLTSGEAKGNLIEPLDPAQVAGIWPAGDFRLGAEEAGPTYVLIVVAVIAAIGAIVSARRRGAWAVPLYVGGSLFACLVIWALGSPWVDGKALAIASPVIPFAAALAGAAVYARGLRVAGAVLLMAVVGGVLWSNALQYRDVNLAPREQLAELEEIGETIEGDGPTLMTEYQPYGARHFLRDADPEAASELRRREVQLADGTSLPKGESADTDRLDVAALLTYRTLVLRRGPAQSRPPSPFELRWRGDYYEVWQRPASRFAPVIQHLGLGNEVSPIAEPECAKVRELAELAQGGTLSAASRSGTVAVPMADADYPTAWSSPRTGSFPSPTSPGDLRVSVDVPREGLYEIWLGGSVRPRVELLIDGRPAGEVRHQLNNAGLYVRLGQSQLEPGTHDITVRFSDADLHPGSGGTSRSIGPLVLSDSDSSDSTVVDLPAAEAERRLCGRQWDWIELVGA
jgi:hypothetical protein